MLFSLDVYFGKKFLVDETLAVMLLPVELVKFVECFEAVVLNYLYMPLQLFIDRVLEAQGFADFLE